MSDYHKSLVGRSASIREEVRASARRLAKNTERLQDEISKLCETSLGQISEARRRLDRTVRSDGSHHALDRQLSRVFHDTAMERLRLLESVVVHANDAVLITEALPIDAPGPRILYCNAAFIRMTGYEEDELRDKTPRLLQGPDTDRAVLDSIRDHLIQRKPIVVELLNYRKDGSAFSVELSIVPIWDAAGRHTHWISLQRDVSDRKAAAEAVISNRVEALERQALQTELKSRKQMEQRLFRAAFHDALTGLHNRAFFIDHLGAVLEHRAPEDELEWALLFLDLNRFKSVNDTLGHDVGNRLLIEVARRLEGCIGESDMLARMGGDEFALLVDVSTGIAAAIDLANRIRRAFALPFSLGDHTIHSDCSIGIAALGTHYRKPEDVLRDADVAMYRSKNTIGHRPALFTEEADADAILALRIQSSLFRAVEHGSFHLLYQPIFSAENGDLVSLEALVRWTDPGHGPLLPDMFIPLAERCGLVRAIGRWVLITALRDMREWTTRCPGRGVRLNVNVSPNELLDGRFAVEVLEALETAGLSPECLELEITEAVFQDRSPHVLETLQQLRQAGIRLALDDFGTGYSSLGSIDSYPIDTIKVDRSFVIGMVERPRTRALVETIITLAKSLNLDVVAEGIETEDQYQALIAMGCHHFQGYHLARPMAFKDAMEITGHGAEVASRIGLPRNYDLGVAQAGLRFIAIGASGTRGLADIIALLQALRLPLRAAVMVVLHRPSDRASFLKEVLARGCALPVIVAQEAQSLVAGSCYIGEPDGHLSLVNRNVAHLVPGADHRLRGRTIDTLFISLAEHAGQRVIGIVLSGALDDGSRGLAAIHAHGGITMVLEPGDKPRGMQQNAIDYDGPIDLVGNAGQIAGRINDLVSST